MAPTADVTGSAINFATCIHTRVGLWDRTPSEPRRLVANCRVGPIPSGRCRPDEWRPMQCCQVKADWIFTDAARGAAMVGALGSRAV